MSVLDFIDSDVFTPVYRNDVPMISSPRIEAICQELQFAVQNNETVFVYGDYDMDGFCSVMVWKEVFALMGAKPPVTFKYVDRTHSLDKDIIRQLKNTDARVVIICDTGSSVADRTLIRMLVNLGYTPIVIDHHSFEGGYMAECEYSLLFNSFEEKRFLDGCEVSGAYASLLVAKVLCEKYMGCALAFNAKVFSLASMYSDCVDMSSKMARALYSAVASANVKGPTFMSELNSWDYLYGRRFFSYIVAPKLNGCFRSGNLDLLNRAMSADNKFQMRDIARDLQDVHTEASTRTKAFVKEFSRERFGDIVLCIHELTEETSLLNIRNFTGVIATQIAEQEQSAVVVVVKDNRVYYGSVRDYYNRDLLGTFRLFCQAGGHPSAFGISFASMIEFRRYISQLGDKLTAGYEKPYVILSSGVIEGEDDLNALALYNEFMNIKPKVLVSHKCDNPRLVRSTKFSKYYDIGLRTTKALMTKRPLIAGSTVLIEPAICRGVELREME